MIGGKGVLVGGGTGASILTPGRDNGGATGEDVLEGGGGGTASIFCGTWGEGIGAAKALCVWVCRGDEDAV